MGNRKTFLAGLLWVVFVQLVISACWTSSGRRTQVQPSVRGPGPTPINEGARPDPLVVEFDGSAAPLEKIGKPVEQGVKLVPKAEGTWRWDNDRRLVFTPSQDWPVGRDFSVSLEHGLLPPKVRTKASKLNFRSASFTATMVSSEFYVDPQDPKQKRATATVRFSHPVDAEDFEKRVSLDYRLRGEGGLLKSSGRYAFTVTYDKLYSEAYIHSAPIAIPLDDASMEIQVAPGTRARQGGPAFGSALSATVKVPGMYDYFRVEGASAQIARDERREPKQTLILELSAPAHEKDVAGAVQAWVLPKDYPGHAGQPAILDYYWPASEVGTRELSFSTRAVLVPVPAEREQSSSHAFRLDVPEGRKIFVRLPKGLRGYGGYQLARTFETVLEAPEYPKELKLMHEGAVLRLSGERRLSAYAMGVTDMRFEVGRVREEELAHLITQSQGDFAHPAFEDYRFGEDDLVERFTEVRPLKPLPPGKAQYTSLDLSKLMGGGKRGLFFVRAQEWDPHNKVPSGLEDRRFVLVTDLGVVVKVSPDGRRDVLVLDMARGGPASGASVEVLGRNGAPVVSVKADDSGRARFPSLKDFTREKTPVAYVIRRGEDLSFLPYERADRRLDFSRFDVGGETSVGARDRLEAYLFTDRGLYRPGEEIKGGLLVRSLDWAKPLAGLPVEAVVVDPRGLEVDRRKIALSTAAFHELSYQTRENGPTGRFGFSLYVVKDGRRGALLGTTSARVEEFLPDRMTIRAEIPGAKDEGWLKPEGLSARVSLRTLFGAPAAGRRVTATLALSPAAPRISAFPDYRFSDPALAKKSVNEELSEVTTNDDGEAEIPVDLSRFQGATYRVSLHVEGFEAGGGRGVSAEPSVIVSPRKFLVGVKPDGDLSYVRRGTRRVAHAVAVGPDGKSVAVANLTSALFELKHVSALVKRRDGVWQYQSVQKELLVSTRAVSVPAGGATLPLESSRAGDYELVLRDSSDAEVARVRYSVAGDADLDRSLEKTAELQVRLSKPDYAPGEEIELQIRAPYAGSGLITIERDKVYAHAWFTAGTTASTQTIRVPADLEGNAYVNVALLRSPTSREIFMSPLSYAAAPFSIRRKRRELPVSLEVPSLSRPGEPLRARFKTARPSKIVVFAVDEGILQVAAYKTPDPLSTFFRKRALEVDTFQLLDLVLPEHKLLEALSAAGGDTGAEAVGKNLNPFKRKRDKPAVFWSGIVDAGPEWKELDIPVPDSFNGRLRVMAVAAVPDAVGVAETAATVRAPLVISPNAPLFAAPGDEFEVSVAVANVAEGTGPQALVELTLLATEHVELLSGATAELKIPEGREGQASFRLKARRSLGSADLRAVARTGVFVSTRAFSLSVRPAVPYEYTVTAGYSRAAKAEVKTPRRTYPAYRVNEASVSRLPLALAGSLLGYLDTYPYGCSEQLTSKALAFIAVMRRPEFGTAPGKAAQRYDEVISILRTRQNAEGAFGYWAANSYGSPYLDAYVMHFLTEAKTMGLAVPDEMLSRGLANLRGVGSNPSGSIGDTRARAYALYVLARNGQVVTRELEALRKHVEASGDKAWRRDVAAGYMAATYKLLLLEDEADGLMRDAKLGAATTPDYEHFYDGGTRDAQLLHLIARHFPKQAAKLTESELVSAAENIAFRYNTISAAHAILGFTAFADLAGGANSDSLRMIETLETGEKRPVPMPMGLFSKNSFSPQAAKVRVEAPGDLGLFYAVTQAGFELDVPKDARTDRLEVQRELQDASGKVVLSAALGDELTVHVKIRALDNETVPNVAIVDLLPAGFDMVLDGEKTPSDWSPQWTDAREDRMLVFGAAEPTVREFVYRARATSRGRFTLPPAFAQAMYDRGAAARGKPEVFEIR